MKHVIAIVLIIAMVYIPGCAPDTQEENPKSVLPEISLDPMLLPTKDQPEITEEKEGLRFKWPGQDWVLMEDEAGVYALAQDLTFQLEIQPEGKQIQATEVILLDKEQSQEALVIDDVIPVVEGVLLVTKHSNGLYGFAHLRQIMDGQLEWLVVDSDEIPRYIISQDKSKVVYRSLPEGHLSAYHFESGRKTDFLELTEDQFCNDWMQQITLSPLGGYLTYEVVECATGHPIQFTIVGTDTGRLIRDHLPGKTPRWDHMDQQIVFQIPNFQQLGMYSLQTTDMTVLNRIDNDFSLYRSPLFSEDNAYLMFPVKNEQESRLIIYHTLQELQQSLLLPEGTVVETDQWAFMNDRNLVVIIRSDADYQLVIHHLVSELTETIGPIDHWISEDKSIHWFYRDSDMGIYYAKNGSVMQSKDGSHRSVFKVPKDTRLTGIDTWEEWLLISVVTNKDEKQLYFVAL